MSESVAVPLRRDPERGLIAGVAAGLARRLGIDPVIVRVAFAATSVAGGAGIGAYLLCWVLIPTEGGAPAPIEKLAGRRDTWLVVTGAACLALAALLLLREWGLWLSDGVVWPLILVAAGGAVIWRQSTAPPEDGAPPARARSAPALRLPADAQGRALVGAALVVGGGLVFLWLNNALQPARDVLLAVVVVLIAATLILAPWWVRLVRGLTAERAERIRSQERAEVAAHLHDSVLQTLALMQKRVDDPREVAALARRQERELRAWLNGRRGPGDDATVANALEAAAAEVEEAHGVPVEVVAVGDAPLDARAEALVAAAREALVNAAKFAPDGPVALYAEVAPERIEVFVRDRGPGFEPDRVPDDRRGVRESIVGRMERHGGRAVLHTAPGEGTEVELVIER
ncbi:MAG TPA: PspC domain-containing protein [Solirubrobacteraceae bacterium]|nr:PspC domain-containing protein [Solirubrobacteraceae bacterium]